MAPLPAMIAETPQIDVPTASSVESFPDSPNARPPAATRRSAVSRGVPESISTSNPASV